MSSKRKLTPQEEARLSQVRENFQKRKDSKKLQDYTHKITENKDLIKESIDIEDKCLTIINDLNNNFNKDSIYAGVYILENVFTKKYFSKKKKFKITYLQTGIKTGTAGRLFKMKKFINKNTYGN